ncbi:hypothetical protein KJY73_18060 [Bowmanella sp. Y26]|uniref:hypothetical protein n=1 Tax=Bowmanella yangjiangensis TaxID=2811230 RepID=UPI001BDBD493|nr:hypothetical protein [Bowmanella yangjiangensis]MBT1065497.1 hypothetical protein [Bowmanella yangjiangensis]
MQQQIDLYEILHQLTKGYNVPVLGVNSCKLVYQQEEYCAFIDDTLRNSIFKGVKLYPSIGYSPTGVVMEYLELSRRKTMTHTPK